MGWQWPRPDLHLNVIILMNSMLETRRIMKKKVKFDKGLRKVPNFNLSYLILPDTTAMDF